MIDVTSYGATGDGITDDTTAIRNALAAIPAAGGALFFPSGTYIVDGGGSTNIFDIPGRNVKIFGEGYGASTIKVAGGASPYKAIFRPARPATDVSGLEVWGLTFDGNIMNQTSGAPDNDANAQIAVVGYVGTEMWVHHCESKNTCGSWVFSFTSISSANRLRVTDNIITAHGNDSLGTDHDSSAIYLAGQHCIVTNNTVISSGVGDTDGPSAYTGIELHGSHIVCSSNTVEGFRNGIFPTGAYNADSVNLTVTGNTVSDCQRGIDIWSTPSGEHTTGFGIDGCVVANNSVRLAGNGKWTDSVIERGICLHAHAADALDVRGLVVTGNHIYHELETESVTNSNSSSALGWRNSGTSEAVLGESKWTNNVVINFPMAGCMFQGVDLRNVDVSDNLFVNCGSTLWNGAVTLYKSPLGIVCKNVDGFRAAGNIFVDDNPITRAPYYVVLWQMGGSSGNHIHLLDNQFITTGDRASLVHEIYMNNSNGTMQPYVRGGVQSPTFTSGINQKYALGSCVVDTETGVSYVIDADQHTWRPVG